MGGSTKTTQNSNQTQSQNQNQTSTSAIDPHYQAIQLANYGRANDVAWQIGQPYSGQLSSGFGGTELGNAVDGFHALSGYSAPHVTAGQLSQTDLSPYQNPFTSNVTDTTLAGLDRARQMAMNDNASRATAAGAFGGSRHGVVDSLTNNDFAQQAGSALANLNLQGYQNAQQGALQDIGARNAASLANQGADLSSAGVRGSAASNLANVAQMQQGQQQSALDRAYNAWLAQQQGALTGQNLLNSTVYGLSAPTTTTGYGSSSGTSTGTNTSETQQGLGLGQILGGLGSLAMGIGTGGLGFAPFAAGGLGGLGAMGGSAAGAGAGIGAMGRGFGSMGGF